MPDHREGKRAMGQAQVKLGTYCMFLHGGAGRCRD